MPTVKPGPGWTQEKSGRYSVHFLLESDFPGARAVAAVFKVAALIVLIAGAISAWQTAVHLHDNGMGAAGIIAVTVGIAAGTILAASTLAFFGYVLQLLVALQYDSSYPRAATVAQQNMMEAARAAATMPGTA
jgi:hypothetical protein